MSAHRKLLLALVVMTSAGMACLSEWLLAAGISHGQAEIQARNGWKLADGKRAQGKWEDAGKIYEKTLAILAQSSTDGITGDKTTLGMAATQMIEFCKAMPIDVKKLGDGTYEGKAWGYQAQMTVEVKLEKGRIKTFQIKEQKESSPRKAFEIVPAQIVRRQHPSVDAASGATCTSYGLMTATLRALKKAPATADERIPHIPLHRPWGFRGIYPGSHARSFRRQSGFKAQDP